jgi:hypothetical protein
MRTGLETGTQVMRPINFFQESSFAWWDFVHKLHCSLNGPSYSLDVRPWVVVGFFVGWEQRVTNLWLMLVEVELQTGDYNSACCLKRSWQVVAI